MYDGAGGAGKTPLEEIDANYGPCECATCATEGPMLTKEKVIARLQDGRVVELATDPPLIPADAVHVEFRDPATGTVERYTRAELLAAAAAPAGGRVVVHRHGVESLLAVAQDEAQVFAAPDPETDLVAAPGAHRYVVHGGAARTFQARNWKAFTPPPGVSLELGVRTGRPSVAGEPGPIFEPISARFDGTRWSLEAARAWLRAETLPADRVGFEPNENVYVADLTGGAVFQTWPRLVVGGWRAPLSWPPK